MKRVVWIVTACLALVALLLGSCGKAPAVVGTTTSPATTAPATTSPTTASTNIAAVPTTVAPPVGAREEPQYGGTLRVLGTSPTTSPMSWDPADWAWKVSQDTNYYFEHLLVGDLDKGPRGTNENSFTADAWIPDFAVKGQLAESWELQSNPLALVFHLRHGVMWQAKQGVMASREFTAQDVVYSMTRLFSSPKAIALYMGGPTRWEAKDKYTAVCYMDTFFANWQYAIGWGYYDVICPQEVVTAGASDWHNATGTGPYMLTDYVSDSSQTYTRNPNYWDHAVINGKSYQLPFTDKIIILIIMDESTRIAALRTAKVDLSMANSWKFVDTLKQTTPQLKVTKWLGTSGWIAAMRMDTKPFDDIRVRQAANMAIDRQGYIQTMLGGYGESLDYPFYAGWAGMFTPMDQLPADAQMLFTHDVAKAKALLTAAGYPNGITVNAMCSNEPTTIDYVSYIVANLADAGIKLNLQPLPYAQTISIMSLKTNPPVFFFANGCGNPIAVLRKNFLPGQTWNPYMMNDKWFTDTYTAAIANPDDAARNKVLKDLNVYAIAQAPGIWLPVGYAFTYWWPWVKNYYGELRTGAETYAPILANIWMDQNMKKSMGD